MAVNSDIEWTQKTWNPVVGCAKVSAGCKNCYAEKMSNRQAGMGQAALDRGENPSKRAHYMEVISNGRWNGKVSLVEDEIDAPRRWKNPSVVFVNSMSDLFHKDVPLDFIQRIFGTMNDCPPHTFQVLTKRPERAAEIAGDLHWSPNIWMGTSVEEDQVIDRVEPLKQTGAAIKFLSVEPLLGPVPDLPLDGLDWVIAGGESGPGARPMSVDWVRDIRDRCVASGVAFFFKQFGTLANNPDPKDPTAKKNGGKTKGGCTLDGRLWQQMPEHAGILKVVE